MTGGFVPSLPFRVARWGSTFLRGSSPRRSSGPLFGSRGFGSFLCALCVVLFVSNAHAADIKTEVSARQVGVGQTFQVQATLAVEDDGQEPQNPHLAVQGAARVRGPSVGSQRSIVMHNFNVRSETNVIATWSVTPTTTGTLVVGPVTFQVDGKTISGDPVEIQVLDQPQQKRPRRRGLFGRDPFGNDPFDPFGQDPFGRDRLDPFRAHEIPPEWQVAHAADPIAFLHAIVDQKKVVLGEPVRLTILAFGSRGQFFEQAAQSPSLADFVSFSVVEDQMEEPMYQTTLDGRRYYVRKLREFVLVPLSTGKLTVGSMSTVLQSKRGGYPVSGNARGMKVSTLPLEIEVVPPPTKGQPAGYFPGDVGRYELNAEVTPREIEQGEYLKILITISGVGYVPSKVLLPESNQLVWNTPTLRGEPEIKDGILQGSRTLDYSVQVTQSGEVKLGAVRLPYYDPQKNGYRTARVDLGTVHVRPAQPPSASASASASAPSDAGANPSFAPAPRTTLSAAPAPSTQPPAWAWWALVAAPSLAVLGRLAGALAQGVRKRTRRVTTRGSKTHLKEGKRWIADGENQRGWAALERALFVAIEESTGLRARGVLRSNLAEELERSGTSAELARSCTQLLNDLEAARYATDGSHDDFVVRTERLLAQLAKAHPEKKGGGR